MVCGWIIVDEFGDVHKWDSSRKKYRTLKPQTHYKAGRIFFNIRLRGCQRKLFRARVYWLWHYREPPPEGMTIDHIDHDNTNDKIENLRLLSFMENSLDNWSSKGSGFQDLDVFDKALGNTGEPDDTIPDWLKPD